MTDYGRTETTPTNTPVAFGADNLCFMREITIPNGVTITSISWYPNITSATVKYRVCGYVSNGSYSLVAGNVIDAPEQTGVVPGLKTVSLTTPYTNSSGSSKNVYFGINYLTPHPDTQRYTETGIECPYFLTGGTDVPPSNPTLTPNNNTYAIFVTGATDTPFALDTAAFALTLNTPTIPLGKDFGLGTAAFVMTPGSLLWLLRPTYPHPALPDTREDPRLLKLRADQPALVRLRRID